ncbi:MAG: FAD-dependent oxidoreductase [Candidatus Bathyarchaeota archaeon]|nr:FAD-dependent oxidoreductase [Candidatus Bathyarchaeota archaeon]
MQKPKKGVTCRMTSVAKNPANTTIIPKEIWEKAKYCFECGICTASCPMAELLGARYNPRSLLQKAFIDPEKALEEGSLWLCAWCYRCHDRCPQGLNPPEIFQLLKAEAAKRGLFHGFEEAISSMEKDVPFPLICWYTCFHSERSEMADERLDDALEKIASRQKHPKKRALISGRKQKVAVIGSGPTGLTAASELAEMGYSVTVFEALPALGGMLRKSMPEYRLPRKALEAEIERLGDLGVEIRTDTRVGKEVGFGDLWKESYGAIFVAVGANKSRELGIEGEDLTGVVDALEFLWKVNTKKKVTLGKKVGVIGGGNVAVDAARTALCQGAEEAIILYRRTREVMPANPWEVMEAEREGVKFEFLTSPKRIHRKDGKVIELVCEKMKLGELDETGRGRPEPIEGSDFPLQLNTVIVAIGEEVDATFLPEEVGVGRNSRVRVNPITMETDMKGVFAGGDAVTGPATVMEAILAGKRAACSIHQYLTSIKQEGEEQLGD